MQYIILIVVISTILVVINFIIAAYFNKGSRDLQNKEQLNTKKGTNENAIPEYIQSSNAEIRASKEEIIENKDIVDNAAYYKLIQQLVISSKERLAGYAPESFIVFRPKDSVSGDFYWFTDITFTKGSIDEYGEISKEKNTFLLVALVKCNRHEVKEIFINIVDKLQLNEQVYDPDINSPFDLLNALNAEFKRATEQESRELGVHTRMDVSLCAIDFNLMKLNYWGDKSSIYITRGKHLIEIRKNGEDISTFSNNQILPLSNQTFDLQKDDCIYLFTEGYANQFGGSEGKKFTFKGLKETFLSIQGKAMEEQEVILHKTFEFWKGRLDQDDNVLIIGLEI